MQHLSQYTPSQGASDLKEMVALQTEGVITQYGPRARVCSVGTRQH